MLSAVIWYIYYVNIDWGICHYPTQSFSIRCFEDFERAQTLLMQSAGTCESYACHAATMDSRKTIPAIFGTVRASYTAAYEAQLSCPSRSHVNLESHTTKSASKTVLFAARSSICGKWSWHSSTFSSMVLPLPCSTLYYSKNSTVSLPTQTMSLSSCLGIPRRAMTIFSTSLLYQNDYKN